GGLDITDGDAVLLSARQGLVRGAAAALVAADVAALAARGRLVPVRLRSVAILARAPARRVRLRRRGAHALADRLAARRSLRRLRFWLELLGFHVRDRRAAGQRSLELRDRA